MSSKLVSRFMRMGVAVGLTFAATQAVGCLSRPVEPIEPRTTSTVVERLTQSAVDKIDLLLMLDNSRSMADKQLVLQQAVPPLIDGLVNPRCLDDNGNPAPTQPAGPLDMCAAGDKREFNPVLDIHIGIVTSSLGGHGSATCAESEPTADDHGQLISRTDAMSSNGSIPTYNGNEGFLAWDPASKDVPPGVTDKGMLEDTLKNMVIGVGQIGCGYESQLESWYRFLVDPNPYDTISVDPKTNVAVPNGTDMVLTNERAQFLRPDSLLAVIMLTDENDCSIKEFGPYWLVAKTDSQLPAPRSECAANPNDPCCLSCGQDPGMCAPEPDVCGAGAPSMPNLVAMADDNENLRCWDNKRRYGIDFLYPTDRYIQGLTQPNIADNAGNVTPNPIFSDLNPSDMDSTVRDPSLVFIAGIVGVPWQDIAVDPNDLTKGFKAPADLSKNDIVDPQNPNNMISTWDVILGDPANYAPGSAALPRDPLMIESIDKRTGSNPILNAPLENCPMNTNPINGCEWDITNKDDLQYACIFKLGMSRDCGSMTDSCDCGAPAGGMPPDSPLCSGTVQNAAKGYPGIRELTVVKGVGSQGIPGSICPKQLTDPTAADFGYNPAVQAIIDRLKQALSGKCLPRQLTPDNQHPQCEGDGKKVPNTCGQVPCLILEARNTGTKCNNPETCCGNCAGTIPGSNLPPGSRIQVTSDHIPAVKAAQQDPLAMTAQWDCFCEIPQSSGTDLSDCQSIVADNPVDPTTGNAVNGWCYIDATTAPQTGNPQLVDKCPDTERRLVRFVGNGNPSPGTTLFITCSGE